MWIERVVVNASPLITLFRAGLHPLLPRLFTNIVVPDAVWAEVTAKAHQDPAAFGLPGVDWAQHAAVTINPEVAIWNLGAGETAVLSLALQQTDFTAIVDDRAARRCARVLGVHVLGTAGVLLAKRRGIIGSTREALQRLQQAGLWLSQELIDKLSMEGDDSKI